MTGERSATSSGSGPMLQRAVKLTSPRHLRVVEEAAREPGPGEVRVRVAYAGICGSDLHVFETGAYVPRFPVTPGHEVSGYVEATGSGADDLPVGTGVVLDSRVPCQACDWCAAGEAQRCRDLGFLGEVCDGGFAETVIAPRSAIFPAPVGLSPRTAALAEPCAVAMHGVKRALRISPGAATALVVGLGPLGALAGLILRQQGLDVTGVESNAQRRETAARATGFRVLSSAPDSGEEYDVVVDTAGFHGSLGVCSRSVRRGGAILALALHRRDEPLRANELVEHEIVIVGSHVFRDEMMEALHMLSVAPASFGAIISAEVALDGVADAYEALLTGGSGQLKVLVAPGL